MLLCGCGLMVMVVFVLKWNDKDEWSNEGCCKRDEGV